MKLPNRVTMMIYLVQPWKTSLSQSCCPFVYWSCWNDNKSQSIQCDVTTFGEPFVWCAFKFEYEKGCYECLFAPICVPPVWVSETMIAIIIITASQSDSLIRSTSEYENQHASRLTCLSGSPCLWKRGTSERTSARHWKQLNTASPVPFRYTCPLLVWQANVFNWKTFHFEFKKLLKIRLPAAEWNWCWLSWLACTCAHY